MSRIARRLGWLAVSIAFGVAITSSLPAGQPEPGKSPASKAPAKKAPGGIIISRETTFITGPLRRDGTVDYAAALNQRSSHGVTPENNAVVLLVQALGLEDGDKQFREQFFKRLGIAPVPEKGQYLEPFTAYFERKSPSAEAPKDGQEPDVREKADKELERIMDRPWSKKDSPIGSAWLDEHKKQIDLIVTATKRPRFYAPLVARPDEPGTLIGLLLPVTQQSRGAARAPRPRDVPRRGGQARGGMAGPLGLPSLGTAAGPGAAAARRLGGCHCHRGNCPPRGRGAGPRGQAHRGTGPAFRGRVSQAPAHGQDGRQHQLGERFMYLDYVSAAGQRGLAEIRKLDGGSFDENGASERFLNWAGRVFIDWNQPMLAGNQSFDQLVAALSKPTRKERDAAVAEFDRDSKKLSADFKDLRVLLRNIAQAGTLRGGLGRQIGKAFLALLRPVTGFENAEDRTTTWQDMVPVVFALAAYRADHGAYPADLAAPVPEYLPAIPRDPFSDGPLRYKRDAAGYLLYSVGPNGKDDGGRAWYDQPYSKENRDCDDIAIRVPAKKK